MRSDLDLMNDSGVGIGGDVAETALGRRTAALEALLRCRAQLSRFAHISWRGGGIYNGVSTWGVGGCVPGFLFSGLLILFGSFGKFRH